MTEPIKPSKMLAFVEALDGSRGMLDAWLECNDEAEVREYIKQHVKRAVEAEREACAKLFDDVVWSYDYREIAAAIRERGEK
jgi:hypothetical protein